MDGPRLVCPPPLPEATEEERRSYYDAHHEEFTIPDRIRASAVIVVTRRPQHVYGATNACFKVRARRTSLHW
jgi:hypothetical protein